MTARTHQPVQMAGRTERESWFPWNSNSTCAPFCKPGSRASAGHPACPTAAPRWPAGPRTHSPDEEAGRGRPRACGSSHHRWLPGAAAWGAVVPGASGPGASPSGCPHSPSPVHTGGLGPGETAVPTATAWCPVRRHANIPSRNLASGSVGAALCPRLSEDTPYTGASRESHSLHDA